MQEFYINKNSTLPLLKMELLCDGRTDFNKFYQLIQTKKSLTFSMEDADTGIIKIANATAELVSKENTKNEEYLICYQWKTRDTKTTGKFIGRFKIEFDETYIDGIPLTPTLILPIQEQLIIYIQ